MRVLVTGGTRSGKSSYAESLLSGPADYVATGMPVTGADSEWASRVAEHQARRPADWTTIETLDVASVLAAAGRPVLIDCLGLWLTRTIDACDGWDASRREVIGASVDGLVGALAASERHVVLVTNEVGWGVVPEHLSGRLFRDELGTLNRKVAEVCDRVVLCVSGCPVVVKGG